MSEGLSGLLESEKKYRILAENSTDVVWIMDLETMMFTFFSPSVLKLRGYTPEEAMAIPLEKTMTPETYKSAMESLTKGLYEEVSSGIDPERVQVLNHEEICKDGSTVPVEATIKFLRDENGCPIGLIGATRDITERKKAEHQTKERMKELRAFYKLSEITDKKGIGLDELYRELSDFLPDSWRYPEITCCRVAVGDKEFRTDNFEESPWMQSAPINVGGSAIGKIDVGYLKKMPESDEGPFMKEERQLINAIAERVGHITERKRVEEALVASEDKYRLLVDTANEAILVAQDNLIKFSNRKAAELLEGYSEQEIATTPFIEFIHPEDRLLVIGNYRRRISGEDVGNTYSFRTVTRNGNIKWVEINAVKIDWEGKPATLNMLNDITDRKNADVALYRANAGLEARVSQTSEISKALINDIGLQRASGIIYECGWKIGLEDASPLRKPWKGDARSFAEDFFEHRSTAISMQVKVKEFDAPRHYARIGVFPVDSILDEQGASDAETAYAHGYIAAALSVAFGKPVGVKNGIPSLGNLSPSYEIETRALERYEVEAYRLK